MRSEISNQMRSKISNQIASYFFNFFCKIMGIKDYMNLSCASLCDSTSTYIYTAYFLYAIYGAATII